MAFRFHASFTKPAAIVAVAALAATAIASGALAQKKGNCVLAGGEATMVTEDLARFMANAALKNSISGMGAKAAGQAKVTCKGAALGTYCIARQRACK
jgi:hypothetical protein